MELREKVANIVFRAIMASDGHEFDAHDAAVAILAIPEIAAAPDLYTVLAEMRPHFMFLAGKPQFPSAAGLLELIDAALADAKGG